MRKTALATAILATIALASLIAFASATSYSYTLTNWDITSIANTETITNNGNGTFTVRLTNAIGNNATLASGGTWYNFALVDNTTHGLQIGVYPAEANLTDAVSAVNTIVLSYTGSGGGVMTTQALANASIVQIAWSGTHVELWINSVKIYQTTIGSAFYPETFTYQTNNVNTWASEALPSCFTGNFYVNISDTFNPNAIDPTLITSVIGALIALAVVGTLARKL